jgi:protocatechuate 3,4-dioxygenase beta subunit
MIRSWNTAPINSGDPAMLALLAAAVLAAPAPASKGLMLRGVVTDKDGRPVPKATVFIRTAAPRKGVGVL